MRVLYDCLFHVHYSQGYVTSDGGGPMPGFSHPDNGLLDASVPGALKLVTGLHTGAVPLRVVLHDAEPPLDGTWEDVVECAFRPRTSTVVLEEWGGDAYDLGPLPVTDYRVRLCARGIQEARDADTLLDDEGPIDAYELALWPAAPAPEAWVRTSQPRGPEPAEVPLNATAVAARAAAERVSRQVRDGVPLSGALVEVRAVRELLAGDDLELLTSLAWVAGNGQGGALDAPGDEMQVWGFGHSEVHLHARRVRPGVHVEAAWELGQHGAVSESGSTVRVDVEAAPGGRQRVTVRHTAPQEWADDLAAVWPALLKRLEAWLGTRVPGALGLEDLTQELDLPDLPPWDPYDDVTVMDGYGHELDRHELEAADLQAWGGRPPSDALRAAYPWSAAVPLAGLDRDLVDGVLALPEARQREVAVWAARLAWARAGIDGWPGAAQALDAVSRGQRPAPPYDTHEGVWALLAADREAEAGEAHLTVEVAWGPQPFPRGDVHGPSYAAPLLLQVLEQDPLRAAVDALTCAVEVHGPGEYPLVLHAVRDAFPELG